MRVRPALLVVFLIFLLSACSEEALPPLANASMSTPVVALPISVKTYDSVMEVPTAGSNAMIDAPAAEYMLMSTRYEPVTPSVVNVEAELPTSRLEPETSRGSGVVYNTQ